MSFCLCVSLSRSTSDLSAILLIANLHSFRGAHNYTFKFSRIQHSLQVITPSFRGLTFSRLPSPLLGQVVLKRLFLDLIPNFLLVHYRPLFLGL